MSEHDTELKRRIRDHLGTMLPLYVELPDQRESIEARVVDAIAGFIMDTDLRLADIERAEREAVEAGYRDGLRRARDFLARSIADELGMADEDVYVEAREIHAEADHENRRTA